MEKELYGMIHLEYNKEQERFCYNSFFREYGKYPTPPDGWEIIAFTTVNKAYPFVCMMECKIRSQHTNTITVDYIRKEWKYYSDVFNHIVKYVDISEGLRQSVERNFNSSFALARIGSVHFADNQEQEEKEQDWVWEYDSLDYIDSNF